MKIEFELITRSDLELEDRFVAYDSAVVTIRPGITSIPVQLFLGSKGDKGNSVYRVTLKEVEE